MPRGLRIDLAACKGGHPLARQVRDEMVRRKLTVTDVHRMTTETSYSSVYFFVTNKQGVSDQVAHAVAEALGLQVPAPLPPPHTTETTTVYATTAPTKADTDDERQRGNLVPSMRWLTLLVEAIDDQAELGDIKPDLELAVRDAAAGLSALLAEKGSTLQIRVGRPKK